MLESFEILDTRSLHNDTDHVSCSIAVGQGPPQSQVKSMGDVNNGIHHVGLSFDQVAVDLNQPVVFNYIIINNGHASHEKIAGELTKVGNALASRGTQAAASALAAGAGSLVGASVGTAILPVLGTALGALAGWLVSEISGIVFANCDGPVAAEQAVFTGKDLQIRTANSQTIKFTTFHPGTESPHGCGANSRYKVTWSVTALRPATINTVVNLNGRWASGGTQGPVISVASRSLTVDMSAYHRPAAHGSIVNDHTITVTFPDDKTYTGTLEPPNALRWSNGSVWTNV